MIKNHLQNILQCVIISLGLKNNYFKLNADVAEWQTHKTQNLAGATSCGFKSHHPHKTLGFPRVFLFRKLSCKSEYTTEVPLRDTKRVCRGRQTRFEKSVVLIAVGPGLDLQSY